MMTEHQKKAITKAMDDCGRRRQVICRYQYYGNKSEDFDWLRKLDYFVKDYPDFQYFVVSW